MAYLRNELKKIIIINKEKISSMTCEAIEKRQKIYII